jgi:hypothetical protein
MNKGRGVKKRPEKTGLNKREREERERERTEQLDNNKNETIPNH